MCFDMKMYLPMNSEHTLTHVTLSSLSLFVLIVDFTLIIHNATCYTNSLLARIRVTIEDLLDITCALVATSVILERIRVY
jgi:hypothetical protein